MRISAGQVFGAVFSESGVGVGLVQHDPLHEAGERGYDRSFADGFHIGEGVGVYLEVPRVVCLAKLQDIPGCGQGVSSAFEDHAVKMGFVAVVVGVAFVDG